MIPAMPPPRMTTSTSSATGSRSVIGVKGSSRYLAKYSSWSRSRMSARPATRRRSRSARYLARTASGSKLGVGGDGLVIVAQVAGSSSENPIMPALDTS